ncbi:MAG TPA: hypothetical protein VMU59_07020 [Caulobacteraceae bacterium]|nr:hypothetical protein [Caulobacteraceae bacterium]
MAADIAIFVSKRLQRPAVAILCLMMAQMLVTLSDCHPQRSPQSPSMTARAAISAG